MTRRRSLAFLLAIATVLLTSKPAVACAACFGASDSEMARGMNMGIFTLLIVIGSVLTGIASFAFYVAHRTARLAAQEQAPQIFDVTNKA